MQNCSNIKADGTYTYRCALQGGFYGHFSESVLYRPVGAELQATQNPKTDVSGKEDAPVSFSLIN
jgi:hypothetical protein